MKQLNKSLILIGFMGTGKSTLGKALAEKLQLKQVDLDDVIVQEQRMPISDIFEKYGEEKFRELEHDVVRRYAAQPGLVISPGGGAVLRAENRIAMKENGIVISLWARPDVILERVNRDTTVRPVLEALKPGQSKLERIEEVLAERMPCYWEADFVLDTSDACVDDLVAQVLTWLEHRAGEKQ